MSQALRDVLRGAFDYAGLLPPVGVTLGQAIKEFAAGRQSVDGDLLGSFVCPVALLAELESQLPGGEEWPLTVVGGVDLARDYETVLAFNRRLKGMAAIRNYALRFDGVNPIPGGLKTMQGYGVRIYLEGPWSGEGLPSVRFSGLQAGLRLGGEAVGAYPAPAVVADWLRSSAELELPFQAVGGLDHPVRCVRFLTHAPDSVTVKKHGYLNLLAATAAARAEGPVEELLRAEEPGPLLPWLRERGLVTSWATGSVDTAVGELRSLGLVE